MLVENRAHTQLPNGNGHHVHANGALKGVNGTASTYTNGTKARLQSHLQAADPLEVHDLVCVGFGPASLAIAVALHDALEAGTLKDAPKVLFLEKQTRFAWHAGMLLPGAKMQISFIKDLASLRDPRSNFTFLNYLHKQGRLVDFTNLSTFLPARVEYEAYLRWCAGHFDAVTRYSNEVLAVSRDGVSPEAGSVDTFRVTSKDAATGDISSFRARNVLLAVGGQPSIPRCLPQRHPRVLHSSQFANMVPSLLPDTRAAYRVAVVGAGQSAAEIFNNINALYPNSKTYLVMRSEFLKPSDDSPFVNSIFDPSYIDTLYPKSREYRRNLLHDARATNYGVVRLELIEHLYELMYDQRRELGTDQTKWPHRIMGGKEVIETKENEDGTFRLSIRPVADPHADLPASPEDGRQAIDEEILEVDLVIAATGYQRRSHVEMLQDTWGLLPEKTAKETLLAGHPDRWEVETKSADASGEMSQSTRILEVERDYHVRFAPGKVAPGSGVWLQGCCEATHGLSDTLLSVLATRSGEIVNSIFGSSHANC